MSEIQIFNNEEFGEVRTIIKDNEDILLNLHDVCIGLGYTKVAKGNIYLRKDLIENIAESIGIMGLSPCDNSIIIDRNIDFDNTWVTEESFYDLVLESKAKNARGFRKWVTSDVLTSIRKHGAYMTPQTIEETLNNPDFIIGLATKLKEEKEARLKAEKEIEFKNTIIEIQQPKVNMYDDFMGTDALYSVSDVARVFGIKDLGRNNFYKYLRNNKILMTDLYNGNAGINHFTAYAQYVNTNQYFKHRSRLMGSTGLKQNVAMFTPIGIEYIYKRLVKDGYIIEKTIQDVVSDLIEK